MHVLGFIAAAQTARLVRSLELTSVTGCCSACAAQAAREAQETRIQQLTVSRQQLGAQLAAREEALAGAVSRLNVAYFLLQTPADGDPARVPAACPLDTDLSSRADQRKST